MECQAHNEDRLRPTTVCLASLLTNMEWGNSLYLPYVPRLDIMDKADTRRCPDAVQEAVINCVYTLIVVHYFCLGWGQSVSLGIEKSALFVFPSHKIIVWKPLLMETLYIAWRTLRDGKPS
jgi:hypothetical protein